MDTCDVLIVGGGPAGSACAWALRRSGLDALIIEKATFPRDKICAGWISPEVFTALEIDGADYASGRTLEPITAFRIGTIGRYGSVEVGYDHPVSFGIRRGEFDEYLLRRSGARVVSGEAVDTVHRDGERWIVNGRFAAPIVVGAGGHFCPVARLTKGTAVRGRVITAQEVELPIEIAEGPARRLDAPEIYFCPDLRGYGWCFRKGQYLNVGLGRFGGEPVPDAVRRFSAFLQNSGRLAVNAAEWRWRGHAYAVAGDTFENTVGHAVLLAGDAAGVAHPFSGEGVHPAVATGVMAADAIVAAEGCYTRERLAPYATALQRRFGMTPTARLLRRAVPHGLIANLGLRLLDKPWFARHVVVDRWFLGAA